MVSKFEEATLMLIDDHLEYLRSEKAEEFKNNFGPESFSWEMRTLAIQGRRRLGHTTFAKKLAFDITSDIGCKYSTIIIVPKTSEMHSHFNYAQIYHDPENAGEMIRQSMADDYARELENICNTHRRNLGGKVLSAEIAGQMGFGVHQFCERQKEAIFEMTGKKVDKFDLCIIDGASRIRPQQLDHIHATFGFDVDLFLHLQ